MNISTDVETNKLHFDALFCTKRNFDLKKRELIIAGKKSVLYMIDGFLRSDVLEKILEALTGLKEGEAVPEKEFFEKALTAVNLFAILYIEHQGIDVLCKVK